MYCVDCGQEIAGMAKFCKSCGKKISQANEPIAPSLPLPDPQITPPAPPELTGFRGHVRVCENCGKQLEEGTIFCQFCGVRGAPAQVPAPAQMFCPNCGGSLVEGSAFCPKCGARKALAQPPAPVQTFCSKCGKNLATGAAFCPNCGAKAGGGIQPATETLKTGAIMKVRVLSIIGLVLFPLCLFGYFNLKTEDEAIAVTLIAFGYALAQTIVALEQGNQYKVKAMSIMGILGIAWYILSSLCILAFMFRDWEISRGWAALGLGYAVALSIVTLVIFVESKVKPIEIGV
jgi:predicted amidophosphoribosyltransferase